ncbi:MAG: hypothetical protein K0S00_2209 [Xanthobacteraceae bacterium]|jgi:hypothetical protein|nr:hypothetical protein [Xanthobacteraceae bacterium]
MRRCNGLKPDSTALQYDISRVRITVAQFPAYRKTHSSEHGFVR